MQLRGWLLLTAMLDLSGHHVTQPDSDALAARASGPRPPKSPPPYPLNKRFLDLVDQALKMVREVIIENKLRHAALPNLEVEVEGLTLTATKGDAFDASTLKRVGDVTVNEKPDNYRVSGAISFKKLVVTYNHYELPVPFIGTFIGTVTSYVDDNRMRYWVTVQKTKDQKNSTIRVIKVEVEKLDFLYAEMTGFTILFDWFASIIATAYIDVSKDKIARMMVDGLRDEMNKFIKKYNMTAPPIDPNSY